MGVDDLKMWRETSEEKRELERLDANMYNEVRQCAEVHREVRKYISDWARGLGGREGEWVRHIGSRIAHHFFSFHTFFFPFPKGLFHHTRLFLVSS